jgi:DNA-binding transcriptional LysR family regulator
MNSGIRRIAVLTQYKSHSLLRHLQRGWGFLRSELNEFCDLLPAQQRTDELLDDYRRLAEELSGEDRPSRESLAGTAVPKLSLQALAQVPFIGYHADRQLRSLQLAALEAHGITPKEAFGADSSDTILGFVAAGLGFSLVPSLTPTGPKAPGLIAQKLERPLARFPIYAVWRRSRALNPLVEAALECAPSP